MRLRPTLMRFDQGACIWLRRPLLPHLQSQPLCAIAPAHQMLHARHFDCCTKVDLHPALARCARLRVVQPFAAARTHLDALDAARRAAALVTRVARIFGEERLRAASIGVEVPGLRPEGGRRSRKPQPETLPEKRCAPRQVELGGSDAVALQGRQTAQQSPKYGARRLCR